MAKRVLSLGQCSADHYAIERLLAMHFKAEVIPADSQREALELLRRQPVDLILVNRLLDRDGSRGLDFISRVKADESMRDTPVMLVSNFDDAQRQAVDAGALPGFGKASLETPGTLERLRAVLGDG